MGETDVGLWPVVEVVVVKVLGDEGGVDPDGEDGMFLGRYWMPVAGQVDFVPSVHWFNLG